MERWNSFSEWFAQAAVAMVPAVVTLWLLIAVLVRPGPYTATILALGTVTVVARVLAWAVERWGRDDTP